MRESVVTSQISYEIPEIQKISARPDDREIDTIRLNVLLPSVDKKHVFGGIATAFNFFELLGETINCDMRIIVTDSYVDLNTSVKLDGYKVVTCEEVSDTKKQIIPFADRYNKSITVGEKDIFIATGWWTAYTIADVITWQSEYYSTNINPLIYFIQDYEPGFYAWSSRYLMSDSTYHLDIPTIAIFNSRLLKDYFNSNNYNFYKEYYFDPTLNEELKKHLITNEVNIKRKNQIIIYGRPSTQRNAFELIVASLKEWAQKQINSVEWDVISLGEKHEDIGLGNGKSIISKGKNSLEDYANIMFESKVGISLMVSPHPSYPPLEMSTFGVKTITNTYGNKDLENFNSNIVSIKSCSQTSICNALVELCGNSSLDNSIQLNDSYVTGENSFNQIANDLKSILYNL